MATEMWTSSSPRAPYKAMNPGLAVTDTQQIVMWAGGWKSGFVRHVRIFNAIHARIQCHAGNKVNKLSNLQTDFTYGVVAGSRYPTVSMYALFLSI